jgi:hypothetical protein
MGWRGFQENPNEFSYEELMGFVARREKAAWHERAMADAAGAGLEAFTRLCVKAREWNRLAQRVRSANTSEFEALGHYCAEPAAKY